MATITATSHDAPTRTRQWRQDRVRATLAEVRRRGAAMVSAARHHDWSPALTISGLGCAVASAWTTFGLGAGLLAMAASFFALDWSRDR